MIRDTSEEYSYLDTCMYMYERLKSLVSFITGALGLGSVDNSNELAFHLPDILVGYVYDQVSEFGLPRYLEHFYKRCFRNRLIFQHFI